jgi:thiamine-phosphate pyrophosphorylase
VIAAALNAKARGLPALLFLTDPARIADPVAAAALLPRGAAVIYRHFGLADRLSVARRLKAVCRRRGLLFLVGADLGLARAMRAGGVHLAERQTQRRCYQRGLITAAAHSRRAAARAKAAGAVAVLASPVFPSRSASAGRAMGPLKARLLAASCPLPCYALGGVNARTAARLRGSAFIGLAAVDALSG